MPPCQTCPMTRTGAKPQWTLRVPSWIGRLGSSGLPEALAGGVLLTYVETFPTGTALRTPTNFWLDLGICLGAAIVGRWPRIGAITVGVALMAMALLPQGRLPLTVLALLIPVVSTGAHGRTQLRDLASVWYFGAALMLTLPMTTNVIEQVETVVIWAITIGVAWLTGHTMNRLRRETDKQVELRTEALRNQRRSVARDLHDTVSYSATTMVMRAEQIKLRTDDPELIEDLDFIISTGRRCVRDLRGMMETLRRNDPELDLEEDAPWRLLTVHDVIRERQEELAAHGITLQVSTDSDLDSLPGSVRETLAKLVVEATSNMVKHAGRGPCRLIIEVHDNVLEAVFTNPLRPDATVSSTSGLGIIGASERVRAVGGELEATAASGTWILRVQLPLGE